MLHRLCGPPSIHLSFNLAAERDAYEEVKDVDVNGVDNYDEDDDEDDDGDEMTEDEKQLLTPIIHLAKASYNLIEKTVSKLEQTEIVGSLDSDKSVIFGLQSLLKYALEMGTHLDVLCSEVNTPMDMKEVQQATQNLFEAISKFLNVLSVLEKKIPHFNIQKMIDIVNNLLKSLLSKIYAITNKS
eukprot:TRINITY_DN522_c1_g1_i1.p1 TRINITY_DN522_c1_g1~~TRINITY_DN522_c1_g1_i1.p1  ORF type:complete len:185 (-),score=41.91 TRINITY_DN522_c1_g1_i1:10-564(-)